MQPRTRKQSRLVVTVNPQSQRVTTLKLSRAHRPHALTYRGTYDTSKLQNALEYYFINNDNNISPPSLRAASTRYHIPNSTFHDWHDRLKLKIVELKTNDEKNNASSQQSNQPTTAHIVFLIQTRKLI